MNPLLSKRAVIAASAAVGLLIAASQAQGRGQAAAIIQHGLARES